MVVGEYRITDCHWVPTWHSEELWVEVRQADTVERWVRLT